MFVAEGFREIGRALDANLHLVELYFSPDRAGFGWERLAARLPALARQAPATFQVTAAILENMAYLDEPEGILGVFEPPDWNLSALAAPADQPDLWLVAAGTNKPGNLGAMARSAAAVGASGILAADAEVDPFNPNAIRASTGAVFILPIVSMPSSDAISFLRKRPVRIVAAAPGARMPYTSADLAGPVALVIGAEDQGLSQQWLDAADESISIPMRPTIVDSLNASTTAAILLFEAVRQRTGHR